MEIVIQYLSQAYEKERKEEQGIKVFREHKQDRLRPPTSTSIYLKAGHRKAKLHAGLLAGRNTLRREIVGWKGK